MGTIRFVEKLFFKFILLSEVHYLFIVIGIGIGEGTFFTTGDWGLGIGDWGLGVGEWG